MQYRQKWTLEEEVELKKHCALGKESLNTIAVKYFPYRTNYSIKQKVTREKIKVKHTRRTKFFNCDYWKIPNMENSYWAGFCLADACVNHDRNIFQLQLSQKDFDHMQLFGQHINYVGKYYSHERRTNFRINPEMQKICHLTLNTGGA